MDKVLYKQAKYTGKGDQSGKEEFFWKAKEQIVPSVEMCEKHHQLQDTILKHCRESTTGRRFEWVLLQVWKNTIHNSCNPPLLLTCTADKRRWRAPGIQKEQEKAPGPQGVTPVSLKFSADQLAPIFTQILNRSLELCEVPSCFKRSTIIPSQRNPKLLDLLTTYLWLKRLWP